MGRTLCCKPKELMLSLGCWHLGAGILGRKPVERAWRARHTAPALC